MFGQNQHQRRAYFDPNVIFQFQNIDKNVQVHLKNVYSLISVGLILATIGSYLFVASSFVQSWGFGIILLSAFATIGCVCYIQFTENSQENFTNRIIAFLLLTFASGLGLGPLVTFASLMNPSSIPTAFLGTALIFVGFTFASLLTRKRYFIYLGGILTTALGVLSTFMFMNIFLRSKAIFQAELYLSFFVFCAFVVYDTQLIVFKRQLGETDFIKHSVDLFIDVIEIFRHLLIILNRKRERDERRRD